MKRIFRIFRFIKSLKTAMEARLFDAGVRIQERLSGRSSRQIGILQTILFLLVAAEALARAGGGQSYSSSARSSSSRSSSSSGGHSHGSGGGAGGDLIFRLLIQLVFEYPVIGIPLVILILVAIYYGGNETKEQYVDFTIRRGFKAQPKVSQAKAESTLKMRDAGFRAPDFVNRVKKAFTAIQDGWAKQDLARFQAFVSDGVYERFSLQIGELKDAGVIDHMENLNILDARIAQVQSDAHYDTIHVYFKASAINYRIDAKTKKRLEGSSAAETFDEYWSFLRKPGAKTLAKGGLIEGYCPNCAAPISVARVATCGACNSYLRSGEYDWVLAEITQSCEWAPTESDAIPGVRTLQARDPGFTPQALEDRASVVFWRNITAERLGDIGPMKRFAVDAVIAEMTERLRPQDDGRRSFFGNCAVGSVDVVGIETRPLDASGENAFDRLYVEIRWSGKPLVRRRDGKIDGESSPSRNIFNIFVFKRRSGVITETRTSLASAHCVNCGAPEKTGQEFVCEYCGTVQNDGARDWVLERVTSAGDLEVTAAIRRVKAAEKPAPARSGEDEGLEGFMGGPKGTQPVGASGTTAMMAPPRCGAEALQYMIAVMLADGIIDPKEMAMLKAFGSQCGVAEMRLNEMIEGAKQYGTNCNSIELPEDPGAAQEILRVMAGMALADGRLSTEELGALQAFGKRIGLSPLDVKMLVNRERTRLYDDAKKVISASRKIVV
ncbi:MAG: TIM44-like domain-containing protein [Candidatus Ozemobacteraceae bacterium]